MRILKHYLYLAIFIIGLLLGSIGERFINPRELKLIGYINQDKLIQLESQRVEQSKEEDLFLGKSKQAAEVLQSTLRDFEAQGQRILVTKGIIEGIEDVTESAHALIIESLK